MKLKLALLFTLTAITAIIRYELFLEPLFGHASWIHAIHSRLCYVPIAVGAIWFGLRGGLLTAASITFPVIPFVAGANEAHNRFGWNRTRAAKFLRIPRHILIYKIKKFGLQESPLTMAIRDDS